MPRTKKKIVEESPVMVIEKEKEEEVRPRRLLVFIRQQTIIPEINAVGYKNIGTITYWESTDDITYDYEPGSQIYMDNFVGRDIEIGDNEWVQRLNTRTWIENLANARLIDGFFASEVQSFYENE